MTETPGGGLSESRRMAVGNRYDIHEVAGAFGDLGTLIPFVTAYVTVLGMDPTAVLLPFGIALIVVGWRTRTPFPVQPMKAIGAAATTQAAATIGLGAGAVVAAGLVTGVIWLMLSLSGLSKRIAGWIPRPALLGVVMGLGFAFMLEGLRMMAGHFWLSAGLLAATLWLLGRPRVPAMALLLLAGVLIAVVEHPDLTRQLATLHLSPKWPAFAWPALSAGDLWTGLVFLALPQLPLTFGNALIAVTAENNRLFPDRPVQERMVALSTALMNLGSSAFGGVPMCHGAGGMAGHVRFGASTGGACVMLGVLFCFVALFLGESATVLLRLFPPPALGVMLFLAGLQLAVGSKENDGEKVDRTLVLATAAIAIWNAGAAVVFGILAYHALRRGWLRH